MGKQQEEICTSAGYRCLAPGCDNVADDLGEHRRHLAEADHRDHGEVAVDVPAGW